MLDVGSRRIAVAVSVWAVGVVPPSAAAWPLVAIWPWPVVVAWLWPVAVAWVVGLAVVGAVLPLAEAA